MDRALGKEDCAVIANGEVQETQCKWDCGLDGGQGLVVVLMMMMMMRLMRLMESGADGEMIMTEGGAACLPRNRGCD